MLEHWLAPPGAANWPPKFDGILFWEPWVQYKAHEVQHLLVTWGRLKSFFFSLSAFTPSVKSFGVDFQLLHQ